MKKLSTYLSVVALLVLTACGGATFITPDKDSVNFTIEGGEESINISADGSWEIAESPEWVTTTIQDSILVIKTGRNESGAVREGNIVLKGKSDVESTIKVTQVAKCTHITPESDEVDFDKEGGTETVKIDTDGALQIEAPEGFTATFSDGVLTITAAANEGGSRSGDIVLTCDEQSATILATQDGNICPTCNGTGRVRCSACGGKGYVSYPVRSMDIAYEGCRRCGGSGYDDQGWFETQGTGINRGSGKMTCPTCGGSGH